jgi:hypothetical protein
MHYRRWRRHGDPSHRGRNLICSDEERFWHYADRTAGPEGCWPFNRRRDHEGYGYTTWRGNRYIGAHRVSWIIHHGEIPDGVAVCHHCDHPACVNPAHLFLGDRLANMRDMASKGRSRNQWSPR